MTKHVNFCQFMTNLHMVKRSIIISLYLVQFKFYLQLTVKLKLRLCMPPELFAEQVNVLSVLWILVIIRLEVTTLYFSLSVVVKDDGIERMLLVADDHTMVGGGIPLATHLRVVSDPKSTSIAASSLGSVMLAGAAIHRKQDINIVRFNY